MRLIPAIILTAACGFALPAFAGCGQSTVAEPPSDETSAADSASSANDVRVSVVDVGKGDCILIQAGMSAALIDTGYEKTSDEVLSYIHKQGVNHLDFVMITHYDRDHIGGIRAIGNDLTIDTIYLPGYKGTDKNYQTLMKAIDSLGVPTRSVTEELSLELGAARLTIFPSSVAYDSYANGDEGNDNDLSLVASLAYGKDSYLFTGDLEKDGIAAFLDGGHGRFDVLKMPEHGRKSSLTDELLEDVQPRIALITDGADDPADKKTLKLLGESGADVYRTSVDGTIVVESNGAGSYSVS